MLSAGRLPPAVWLQERADDRAGQEQLNVCTEASGAMPASAAVKELAAVRTQLRKDVLEIGCGGRAGAERGWVERPTREREQSKTEQAATDFEATVEDVLVGHAITGEMQRRTQCQGGKPRARERAQRRAGRDMKGHDHWRPGLSRCGCCSECSDCAGPASPKGVPSESRQTAQHSPGWITSPPRERTRSSAAERSDTAK